LEQVAVDEENSLETRWNIDLQFIDKFEPDMHLPDMKLVHQQILQAGRNAENISLLIAFYRGKLYKEARKHIEKNESVKSFFRFNFNEDYSTICRYECFHDLISSYPRLLFTRLSFSQIIKHHDRIIKAIQDNKDLYDKLKTFAKVYANDIPVSINPVNDHPPKAPIEFVTDPDYVYEELDWYVFDPFDLLDHSEFRTEHKLTEKQRKKILSGEDDGEDDDEDDGEDGDGDATEPVIQQIIETMRSLQSAVNPDAENLVKGMANLARPGMF
jgi:hypothetical protein